MVVFLPLVVVLLVFGLLSGGTNVALLLPTMLVLGAGAVFVTVALRDGRPPRDPSVRQLPTDHLRRQMYLALRPPRSRRKPGRDAESE
jgi:hypothetical protein